MKIIIEHSASCSTEREYIFHVLLHEFLGLQYTTRITETQDVVISSGGKSLVINDRFFPFAEANWLQLESLPAQPLSSWDSNSAELNINLVDTIVPVIYGTPVIKVEENICNIGIDIFGSAFFMLSRYEEAVKTDRDQHDRFPATASLAFQEGFLNRPIVDECVEILWAAMKRVWPNFERKKRKFQISVSCDVDQPYSSYVKSVPLTIKKIAGDIIKRRSFGMAVNSGLNAIVSQNGNFHFEPNHTFEWIMDVNETVGNKVMFNFIAGRTVPDMDGFYSLDEHRIRKLMCRIHERGHEIGLHGSYGTYKSVEQHFLEANRLRRVMDEEGVYQDEIGNRQHYLRWSTPETARILEQAGISYDTTLGYADHPGFRCGTCFEYSMYDLIERKQLRLRQRPLIVMECSVIDDCYLGMGYTDEALNLMLTLKKRALQFGGNFTLLWHNSIFLTIEDARFYQELIR